MCLVVTIQCKDRPKLLDLRHSLYFDRHEVCGFSCKHWCWGARSISGISDSPLCFEQTHRDTHWLVIPFVVCWKMLVFWGLWLNILCLLVQEYYIKHIDGSPVKSDAKRQRVIQCLAATIKRRVSELSDLLTLSDLSFLCIYLHIQLMQSCLCIFEALFFF